MKIRKFAAIDIGSNAVRLLVSNVINFEGKIIFQKNSFVRVPIRLGQDTFSNGEISKKNIKRIIKSMKAFRMLMKIHGVERHLAYATSALRDAKNCSEVLEIVYNRAKIKIHTEAFDGILPGVVIVEGVWPNECFIEGLGINSLIGADSPEPYGGAVFHDSAIWIKKIIC